MAIKPAANLSTDERGDFSCALGRARSMLQDGLKRVEMAQSDARGENLSLDAIDVLLHAGNSSISNVEEAGTARARKIAVSVAEDLEAAADRLRQAAQP